MKRVVSICVLLILLSPMACVEPYYPPSGSGAGNQMVINAYIDGGAHSARVLLSRGIALSDIGQPPKEKNASVVISGSDGSKYTLIERDVNKPGFYTIENIHFDSTATFTLNVTTEGGTSYHSDAIELLRSPVFDSISWIPKNEGIDFFVSGHDPENNTRYYRYTFNETWEYNVPIWSDWKRDGYTPVLRNAGEYVYYCWQTGDSQNILVNSTTRLAEDIVSMFPIFFIKKGSRKLSRFYRMIVRQHAISQEEYNFWEMMKKTTENMGGLFDPMPAQVLGNLHADADPYEPVLGYFSGGYPATKLIYVKFLDLPDHLRVIDPYTFECGGRSLLMSELSQIKDDEVYVKTFGVPPQGFIVTNDKCADCNKLGGDAKRPPDWPIK